MGQAIEGGPCVARKTWWCSFAAAVGHGEAYSPTTWSVPYALRLSERSAIEQSAQLLARSLPDWPPSIRTGRSGDLTCGRTVAGQSLRSAAHPGNVGCPPGRPAQRRIGPGPLCFRPGSRSSVNLKNEKPSGSSRYRRRLAEAPTIRPGPLFLSDSIPGRGIPTFLLDPPRHGRAPARRRLTGIRLAEAGRARSCHVRFFGGS